MEPLLRLATTINYPVGQISLACIQTQPDKMFTMISQQSIALVLHAMLDFRTVPKPVTTVLSLPMDFSLVVLRHSVTLGEYKI